MKKCCKCKVEKDEADFHKSCHYCKSCQSEYAAAYREKKKEKISEWSKKSYAKNKEEINQKNQKRWAEKQKEYSATKKRYRENNREKIKERRRDYQNERLKTDPNFKIRKNLRNRINGLVKYGVKKSASTVELLGCSIEQFKIYLESKFREGMDWTNYGYGDDKWHIDHIIPCSSFDLSIPDNQFKCFHFSNLQPLWQKENFAKSDKLNFSLD